MSGVFGTHQSPPVGFGKPSLTLQNNKTKIASLLNGDKYMAMQHSPGFLKIVEDAKTRIKECTVCLLYTSDAADE